MSTHQMKAITACGGSEKIVKEKLNEFIEALDQTYLKIEALLYPPSSTQAAEAVDHSGRHSALESLTCTYSITHVSFYPLPLRQSILSHHLPNLLVAHQTARQCTQSSHDFQEIIRFVDFLQRHTIAPYCHQLQVKSIAFPSFTLYVKHRLPISHTVCKREKCKWALRPTFQDTLRTLRLKAGKGTVPRQSSKDLKKIALAVCAEFAMVSSNISDLKSEYGMLSNLLPMFVH